jgi:hypothetical protein
VNTTSNVTFDVWVTGASNPVTTNLVPYQVFTVGPVQATLLDYEFHASGISPVTGEVNLTANNLYTVAVYEDTASPQLKSTSATQLTAGGCGSDQAQVQFGQFTSIAQNPVVILYANGASWVAPISPGLNTGQIFGDGCWGSSNALQYGAGPAGATTPTIQYQSVTFTGGLTYQLLMTDARIIEIDNLNRVTALPAL